MTSERAGELAVRATGLIVVVSLAFALAGLTWRLVGWDDGRDSVPVAETLPSLGVSGGPDPDVARIVGLAPFGGGAGGSGLPASTLGLVLKGILLAYPAEASSALIASADGAAVAYGVGASVAGNAVIESIEIDRVILRVGDRRELLGFPEPVAGATPAPTTTAGAGITITTPGQPAAPAQSPEAAAALASSSPIATAAAAAQATRPAQAQQAVPTPSTASLGVEATSSGYRIGPNPSPELTRFGLRPGDVIETLNGQAVGSVASDRQLFERAVQSGGARVEVVRDGRRLTLTFPLR